MTKKHIAFSVLLASLLTFLTASKEENKSNVYLAQLQNLCEQELTSGGQIVADSLVGKMIVLNFWASYDPASRINSYNLVGIGNHYANQKFQGADGLQVVSISLDVFRSAMQKAIEADGTQDFFHLCDLQGEDSPIAKSFDVNRPVNLLLSADGKILARDFGTDMIESVLGMLAEY